MKRMVAGCLGILKRHGSLLAVLAATFLLMGLGSQWARAEGAPDSTFTSPLHPKHEHGERPDDALHDLLSEIIDRDELIAGVLGITVAELQAARESGTRIDELVGQLGLDEETVRQQLQDAFAEAVQQAVEDGSLTQEQADALLSAPPPHPPGDEGQHGDQGADDRPHHEHGDQPDQPTEGGTIPPTEGGTIPPVNGDQGDGDRPRHEHGDHHGPPDQSDQPTEGGTIPPAHDDQDGGERPPHERDQRPEDHHTDDGQDSAANRPHDDHKGGRGRRGSGG